MSQPNDNNQPRSMEDELRSASRSIVRDEKRDRASGPWGIVTWILGLIHAVALAHLKTVQGYGMSFDATWWGAATGAFVLYGALIGIATIAVGFILGKILKLGPHLQNAITLIVTLLAWWVVVVVVLAGRT